MLFCNHSFQKKFNLQRHLKDNQCDAYKQISAADIHDRIITNDNIHKQNLLLQSQINELKNKEKSVKETIHTRTSSRKRARKSTCIRRYFHRKRK